MSVPEESWPLPRNAKTLVSRGWQEAVICSILQHGTCCTFTRMHAYYISMAIPFTHVHIYVCYLPTCLARYTVQWLTQGWRCSAALGLSLDVTSQDNDVARKARSKKPCPWYSLLKGQDLMRRVQFRIWNPFNLKTPNPETRSLQNHEILCSKKVFRGRSIGCKPDSLHVCR